MPDDPNLDPTQDDPTPTPDPEPTPTPVDPLLAMLKVDLGLTVTAYDDRLTQLLASAKADIIAEGAASLDETNLADAQLIVMYAAWQWRRRDDMSGMPRMVRYALNNRVFGEKMREATT